ncbi:unnamed protein product [Rotaria sp. Silwood1]|nr:unnamed protein product [Rotaria sp. Silwood1]CAF4883681.1 unnamed protein product [Rotaria sp. Silwood1]
MQNGVTVAGGNAYGSEMNQLSNAYGLCLDDDQTIYIAEYSNNRIVEWKYGATTGRVVAGGNGCGNRPNQLYCPTDVIIDKERDSLIICDYVNRRVVRWPRQNGTKGEIIISGVLCWGLTMDNDRFLYIVDYDKHEVKRYRMEENQGTVVAGGNGQGNRLDQLNKPTYIFVDGDHSVYVSDFSNNRVMKWMKGAKQGIVVAGGQGEGNSLTQLSNPLGIVVDQSVKELAEKKTSKIDAKAYAHIIKQIDNMYPSRDRGDMLIFLTRMTKIQRVMETVQTYVQEIQCCIVLSLHIDLVCVTNGEGGFAHAGASELLYSNLKLSEEAIDLKNSRNIESIFAKQWDKEWIIEQFQRTIKNGNSVSGYDLMLIMLPNIDSHDHHTASDLLALEAIDRLQRLCSVNITIPTVIGCSEFVLTEPPIYPENPLVELPTNVTSFEFRFNLKWKVSNSFIVDYQTILLWLAAEHKYQGGLIMKILSEHNPVNEQYFYFAINERYGNGTRFPIVQNLFTQLANIHQK